MAANPQLVIELSASNRNEDLLRREADIAVRMVAPTQEALVARRIGLIPLGLHARADYLAGRGTPASLDDMQRHALIGPARDTTILRILQSRGLWTEKADFAFRSDNDLAHLAAIRAGLGIGVCQVPLARRSSELVRLLPDAFAFDLDTWVVTHEDLRNVARVRAVFDCLVEGLTAYQRG
jgi:DNA-binding transcriptional LysR family regulator